MMGMGMASSPPQLGLLWPHLRAMAPTVAGVLVIMHLGEVTPLWPFLSVCLCVGSTRLLGLFVCPSAYLCLSAFHRQAYRQAHIKTTKQTGKQAMFAVCLVVLMCACLYARL